MIANLLARPMCIRTRSAAKPVRRPIKLICGGNCRRRVLKPTSSAAARCPTDRFCGLGLPHSIGAATGSLGMMKASQALSVVPRRKTVCRS